LESLTYWLSADRERRNHRWAGHRGTRRNE